MAFPESVVVCEGWARQGLQARGEVVPTAHKIEMIDRIAASGVQRVEVGSFVARSQHPQLADIEEVLRSVKRRDGVRLVAHVAGREGLERFAACQGTGHGADEVEVSIAASEAYNHASTALTHLESFSEQRGLIERIRELDARVVGSIETVFGCPLTGDVPIHDVIDVARFYVNAGVDTLVLADTTGTANPRWIRERLWQLRQVFPSVELIVRFHDARGNGIVNTITAVELGVAHVVTTLGGVGGRAVTSGEAAAGGACATCSEDLICLLEEMRIHTGVGIDALLANGRRAEQILGHPCRANVLHAGPVEHATAGYSGGLARAS